MNLQGFGLVRVRGHAASSRVFMLAQGWSAQDGRMGPKRTVPVHPSVVLPGTRSPGAEAKVVDLAVWEKERLERRRAEPDKGSGDRSLLPDLRGVGSESDHPTRYGCDPITVLAEEHRAQVLKLLAENVVNKAHVGQGTVAVDLGCGNGQLALALARNGVKVIASDNRSVTVELLEARAALAKLCNVAGVACELTELDFEADSIDSRCLKQRLARSAETRARSAGARRGPLAAPRRSVCDRGRRGCARTVNRQRRSHHFQCRREGWCHPGWLTPGESDRLVGPKATRTSRHSGDLVGAPRVRRVR